MLYNGAFVSLVIHCSKRVISKYISDAGARLLWSGRKVSVQQRCPGQRAVAADGAWPSEPSRSERVRGEGASRGAALTHCVLSPALLGGFWWSPWAEVEAAVSSVNTDHR